VNGLDVPKLNGLDLFSGIGGLSLALAPWVKPVAYCEIDRYATATLLSRQADGALQVAPIWDDVRSLSKDVLPGIDIIYGGFPCQDISCAGNGVGLAGERSGLFFEVARLVSEIRPSFVFLENVPAIRTKGADVVAGRLSDLGYDARWDVLSAFDVGAPHIRERWWLLAADANSFNGRTQPEQPEFSDQTIADINGEAWALAGADDARWLQGREAGRLWPAESGICGVADGIPHRVDRIKGLGNSVCPQTAREAFRRLMGIT